MDNKTKPFNALFMAQKLPSALMQTKNGMELDTWSVMNIRATLTVIIV